MTLNNVGISILRSISKAGFWTRKHGPELLIVGSIVSAVASIVLACKATTELEKIVKPSNEEVKKIHEKMADDSAIANGQYSLKEGQKELFISYAKTSFKLAKLYAPTAIAFSLSVGAMLGSHKIMRGRNIALGAAYTVLDNGYKNYRERVKAKVGSKIEEEIFRGEHSETIEEIETDKDGNKKTITKKISVPHLDPDSDYVYIFDSSNPDWNHSGRMNVDFLLGKQKYLNQKFFAQGYLFLYDVYEALGIDPGILGARKLQASRVVGWIYDLSDPTIDNYISFGLSDKDGNLNERAIEMFRNGERDVWLEFNFDGDILTGSGNRKTFADYAKKY